MGKVKLFFALFMTSHLFVSSAQANELKAIQLTMTASEEVEVINPQGKIVFQLIEPSSVVPGDTVVYITKYHNQNSQPATNVVITNPIPKHLVYVQDSAKKNGMTVCYSSNQGNHFALQQELIINNKDGSTRLATAADYTHIRWTIRSVATDGQGTVSFKARVK